MSEASPAVWLFHIPNYLLSAVVYSLMGRFLLAFLVPPNSTNYIYRWFRLLTDPFVRATAWITPSFIAPSYLPVCAMFWIMVARVVFFGVMYQAGLVPRLPGGS
jgi:hypothetical protein